MAEWAVEWFLTAVALGDTNLAWLQATKRYLDKCDRVFIVNRIGRAATSSTVQDAIKTWMRQGRVGREETITVVCTGSEVRSNTSVCQAFSSRSPGY